MGPKLPLDCWSCPASGRVKFIIEIYATASDESETLLHRTTISAINPLAARKQASLLLAGRKKATGARVLNGQGEVVYKIDK